MPDLEQNSEVSCHLVLYLMRHVLFLTGVLCTWVYLVGAGLRECGYCRTG